MWEFNLIKQAKKNTKSTKNELESKDTNITTRHVLPFGMGMPAQLEALRGGNAKAQVKANWDAAKLLGASALGALGGGIAGYKLGDNYVGDNRNAKLIGSIAGGVTGALGGGWLGNYLTFKAMTKLRGVDSNYKLRHMTPMGIPAQLAALQGYDTEAQINANINGLALGSGVVTGGLAGTAAGLGNPIVSGIGSFTGAGAGNLAAYKYLKSDRVKEEEDED